MDPQTQPTILPNEQKVHASFLNKRLMVISMIVTFIILTIALGYYYFSFAAKKKNKRVNLEPQTTITQIQTQPTQTVLPTSQETIILPPLTLNITKHPTAANNQIPNNWGSYNKKYGQYIISFRYPPYIKDVFDGDVDSGGGIELDNANIIIDAFSNPAGYLDPPYTSGSRREWFKKYYSNLMGESYSTDHLRFIETDAYRKSYLKITGLPRDYLGDCGVGSCTNFYIAIQNNIPFFIKTAGQIKSDDLLLLLSSIEMAN